MASCAERITERRYDSARFDFSIATGCPSPSFLARTDLQSADRPVAGPALQPREHGYSGVRDASTVLAAARASEGGMSSGQTIVIKGEITGDENLVTAGRVEGRIHLSSRVLTLAPGSAVQGNIIAGTVIASGRLSGTAEASQRLEVHPTAVVDGHLSAPSLVIADGAGVRDRGDAGCCARRGERRGVGGFLRLKPEVTLKLEAIHR
jgi:cytoskeletal protein CcmA (bactofilin family)